MTPAVGAGLSFLLYALYNLFRFLKSLNFGPPLLFSLSALPQGLAGLLFSPGRGLLWYSPAVVLAIWGFCQAAKTRLLEALLITTLFLPFLGLHSAVPYWRGG